MMTTLRTAMTPRRWLVLCLWLAFVGYAFALAPGGESELLMPLIQMQFEGINPLLVAVFNSMGLLPLIYACFLLPEGHRRSRPAWPFVIGSLFLGAFALLPYLIWREPQPTQTPGQASWGLKLWESRWLAIGLTGLLLYTLGQGFIQATPADWVSYGELWLSDRFVNVMTLDFAVLNLLLPLIAWDDIQERASGWPKITLGIPLVGSLAYLCGRR